METTAELAAFEAFYQVLQLAPSQPVKKEKTLLFDLSHFLRGIVGRRTEFPELASWQGNSGEEIRPREAGARKALRRVDQQVADGGPYHGAVVSATDPSGI